MTWTKLGVEFDDQCAAVDLSDHAYRTHVEAIAFIYKTEADDCRISKSVVRRFATSLRAAEGIKELTEVGFWRDHRTHHEVIHHGDVIRDSLEAQQAKRDRDRAAQRRAREKKDKSVGEVNDKANVSDFVSADPRQTDRQTGMPLTEVGSKQVCKHWVDVDQPCDDCKAERKSA